MRELPTVQAHQPKTETLMHGVAHTQTAASAGGQGVRERRNGGARVALRNGPPLVGVVL